MEKAPIMKRISRSANNEEEGYILIMGIFIMLILMIMGMALAVMGMQEYELASRVKMMDQAYLIADSGINSAAVALETNDVYRQALSPVYGGSGSITTGTNPDFGGYGSATGTYTYWVYQSEDPLHLSDAGYKVIKSKGTITSQGKTVERIILARIVLSAGGTDYDASFDYLMYNGMDSNGDGVSEHGTWAPTDLRFSSIIAGDFGFDGSSQYPPTGGHYPKGAFYVAGSINIPSSIIGDLNIKGRIVAEDNISLRNSWSVHAGDAGIKVSGNVQVPGNVVAGLDGSGTADLSVVSTLSIYTSSMSISGIVGASDGINVSATANFLNSALSVGGLYAGKDVDIGGTANISAAMNVGTIRSRNQTNIVSRFSGVTASSISAGQTRSTDSTNTGVYLDSFFGSITTGTITSTGMVDVKVRLGSIGLGNLFAGNNITNSTGGKGVNVDLMVSGLPINGNISSTGLVNLKAVGISNINVTGNITAGNSLTSASPVTNTGVYFDGTILSTIVCTGAIASNGDVIAQMASGSHITTGNIWSGRNVDLRGDEWVGFNDSITTGQIDAEGYVSLVTGDNITTNGYVKSEQWVKIWSIASVLSGMNDININGNIYAGSAVIPDFVWHANGVPVLSPAPDRTESGWTVYVNDSNDIPAFSDNLNITGAISSVGNVEVLGQDTVHTGGIASNGNVRISHNYDWVGNSQDYNVGSITAGGYIDIYSDVEFTGLDDSITTGSLSAIGEIKVQGHDAITTNSILSNSNVTIRSTWKDITCGNQVRNNGSIQCQGFLDWYGCAVNTESNSTISGGVWAVGNVTITRSDAVDASDTDMIIGYIGGSDCVRTRGFLRMEGAGDVGYEDIQCPNEDVLGSSDGDLRHGTGNYLDDVTYRDLYGGYASSPPTYTHSSVDIPSVATPDTPSKPTVPTVGVGGDIDVLGLAGLSAPVKLLKPNWAYFETLAKQNDVANGPETKICPNLNCRRTVASTNPGGYPPVFPSNCPYCGTSLSGVNPGPAHMVYENGPGDQDHDTAGIQFKWDNTTPYSSNETVYNGDPDVAIYITELNWDPNVATYTGTIVSRGNVYITAPTTDWIIDTGQNLNLVSGWDIINSSSGLSLIQRTDSQLHLWAQHDIRFDLMQITIASQHDFFGSFTAGDKVVYNSNSIWENTLFKWSRWALDPVAWAPPFRVLDWKEL